MHPQEDRKFKLNVPEALDGWAMLHEFFKIDWNVLKNHPSKKEWASSFLDFVKKNETFDPLKGQTKFFHMLGHKSDLMALHFRPTFADFTQVERDFLKLDFSSVCTKVDSYVSMVELGLYEMTQKMFEDFSAKGLTPDQDEWKKLWHEELQNQKERMKGRIWTDIPAHKYVCFYPMNKKRGETVNWYHAPFEKRQRMMRDHGMIGRKYAGQVVQIISGSIGFDDWEWGVDLFSDDPHVFKKLVYEMRFDEASSLYGEFGPFTLGVQLSLAELEKYLFNL